MKKKDITFIISILLLISISITGILGYVQSQLELRRFVPHRYFAYATLVLTAIHVYLNWNKVWNFLLRAFKIH